MAVPGDDLGDGLAARVTAVRFSLTAAERFRLAGTPRTHRFAVQKFQAECVSGALVVDTLRDIGQKARFHSPHNLRHGRLADAESRRDLMLRPTLEDFFHDTN